MNEWQPIETAPLDAKEIILRRDNRVTSGAYVFETWEDNGEKELLFLLGGWDSWDGGFINEDPPTHWMPLPDAPK